MPDESAQPNPPPPLRLTPEPSPACGDGRLTAAMLARWHETYGIGHRQLRRWIERGVERTDPCPLDHPPSMPGWIERNIDRIHATLRERILAVAQAFTDSVPASAESSPPAASTAPAPAAPANPLVQSLDLATVGGVEGESVEFFRTIFAAVKLQLADAYKSGLDSEIRKLHTRLKEVGESLRKHEKDAEQRAIRLGAYLEKSDACNEIAQALTVLSLLRELRKSRVRAELADLPPDILARIDSTLDFTGHAEEDVLRNLSFVKSPADVSLRLAA